MTVKPGSLTYHFYSKQEKTAVAVAIIEAIPSQSPFKTIHTHRAIVIGIQTNSFFRVGEIIFVHYNQLCPLDIQLMPP